MAELRPPEVEHAVRILLATASGTGTSQEIAIGAAQISEQLTQHLSRLIGRAGSRALWNRSLHLASAGFPWLATKDADEGSDDPFAALRRRMESESPAVAIEGFVCVLSTLIGLLERLIGESLVARILHEVWPAMLASGPKETM